MIEQMVERLVAASEKPDLHYKVTILNSQSVNAFALPTGQLYVTRGLIALANDESELASVLAHEMGHVIARHAELREKQERQADLVSRVVTDVVSDPEAGALALAKSKLALASFSRSRNSRRTRSASASPRAPATIPTARRASSPRWSTIPSSSRSRAAPSIRRRPIFCPRIRRRRSASPKRSPMPANTRRRRATARRSASRPRDAYLGDIDGIVYGEDPSEGFVRGRRFLHPKLGFTFTAPEGFTLDNTAQAVLGIKHGGGEALRLDVVRVPAEQTLARISHLRLDREYRPGDRRRHHHQRFPRRHRGRQGRSMGLPALRHPLRQRRLPLHLRRQTSHARHRPRLSRSRSARSAA